MEHLLPEGEESRYVNGVNQRVKGGRDSTRPLTSNGEIDAYSEEEDNAQARAKH
jgi:hypothetical protein